jgi:hypothetical protein
MRTIPDSRESPVVRVGVWLLPLYGVLTFAATLTHQPDATTDFPGYAAYITTTRFLLGHIVGSIGGTVLAILGVIALFLYLARRTWGNALIAALATSVAGNALLLPIFGVAAFAAPAIGDAYLAGQQNMADLNTAVYSAPLGLTALTGSLCYSAGAILFGITIWRSHVLPKWAGLLYAISAPLISIAGLVIGEAQTVGTILLTIGTGWIAWSIWKEAGVPRPSSEMRVDEQGAPPVRTV